MLQDGCNREFLHFMDEDTEAQRGSVASPRSLSCSDNWFLYATSAIQGHLQCCSPRPWHNSPTATSPLCLICTGEEGVGNKVGESRPHPQALTAWWGEEARAPRLLEQVWGEWKQGRVCLGLPSASS